jgi:hypothetical protein
MIDAMALHTAAATALRWTDHGILVYFFVLNAFYTLLLLCAIPELWSHWHLANDEDLTHLLCGSPRASFPSSRSSIHATKWSS